MFNAGDKVRFIYAEAHAMSPEFYPEVGTIGIVKGDGWVEWPRGSTSSDDIWTCKDCFLELVEANPEALNRPFIVGDRIRGISNNYVITDYSWTGYVNLVLEYPYIKVSGKRDGAGMWKVNEKDFVLVKRIAPNRDAEGHAICAECGCIIEDETKMTKVGDEFYCEDCIDREFTTCDHCGELRRNDDLTEVEGKYVCEECLEHSGDYFMCEVCEEWHSFDNGYGEWHSGGYICQHCMDWEDVRQCDECHRWFDMDDIDYDEDEDDYICADCERRAVSRSIKSYGYKPDPIFKAHTHDKFYTDADIKELLFGVELEIDKGDDPGYCAKDIIAKTEDIYCKHDGSLNDGVEIVSHPCTLEYHMNSLGWGTICDIARRNKFLSQDARTCGLHIHVGRRQMGDSYREQDNTASKCVLLVDRHWDSLVKFSRRTEARLDQWAARPYVRYETARKYDRNLLDIAYKTVDNGRYQAVNLENDNTVEFRLFCGTLKCSTIFATLQFVSNLVTYAKEHDTEECMNSKWTDITGVATYPELTEYLKNRDLVEGCAPTDYDWKYAPPEEETAPVVNRPDGSFKVGDRVRVVNDDGDDVSDLGSLIDEEATVAVVYENGEACGFEYGIVFDTEYEGLHTLYSHGHMVLGEDRGYSVYGHNLTLVRAA